MYNVRRPIADTKRISELIFDNCLEELRLHREYFEYIHNGKKKNFTYVLSLVRYVKF